MFAAPSTSWLSASPLEILITRACEPSLPEPNYALQLEIAEYISQKKANTAREAAQLLVRLANHRNPHVGMLALSTIDTLVQSCGYAFHLQISTKEFLNELVRRFPERPPPYPGAVMQRVLDLIHGWKEGICQDSRWKADLGNIRDMHRLLTFKGYRFRDAGRAGGPQGGTAAATANLKSADELEEEDREAQSAKLQELIRRGTPRDLAAAQEIMKTLAGANPDAKPDYRGQSLAELAKLEQKVVLLNELLDNFDVNRGERFASGDAYDQVANILSSARPKIQKWINDAETDDSESLDTFLQLNDQLNSVLVRYDAFKRGDYTVASNPVPAELAPDAAGNSLIDFDDNDALASLASPPQHQPLQLSPSPPLSGQPAQPAMPDLFSLLDGSASSTTARPPANGTFSPHRAAQAPQGLWADLHASAPARTGTPGSVMGGITLSGTPSASGISQPSTTMQPQGSNMGGWMGMGQAHAANSGQQGPPTTQGQAGFFGGMGPTSNPPSAPTMRQQQQQLPSQPAAPPQGKDPFADLAGIF